jgi:SEC-C motif-containing protein
MSNSLLPVSGPSHLILARVEAFRRCDFGFIFDSYHQDSNFRRQFRDRDAYIRYGWANLGKDFRIVACSILREEFAGTTARVIYLLEFELHGVRQRYAELVWLEDAGMGWRFRAGQKMTPEEWPVPVGHLDFNHFDSRAEKVIY